MVMKYVILANSNDKTFDIPRQLVKINGEVLIKRTIRLLKENGVEDIMITASDKRFENLGATVYKPKNSNYDYASGKGYWLNAFPFEIMNEPICFIWGDVYFSENAIKTIVETNTDSTLFFCTYNNNCKDYIKHHDEPLAYKVVDTELFKKHVDIVKKLYDEGKTVRHPIVWEVYRSINDQDVNTHKMTKNYVAINDISCDIDSKKDVELLNKVIMEEKNMVKVEAIKEFTLKEFDKIQNIKRKRIEQYGKLFIGDIFECSNDTAKYLTGNNDKGVSVVKVIEVVPDQIKDIIDTKAESENIIPSDKEKVEEVKKEIEKSVKPKKKKQAKSK